MIFEKTSKMSILGPEIANLPKLGIELSLKIQNCHLKPPSNACHLVQFQKYLMLRFREEFKNNDFGPKNAPFTPF